MHAPVGGILITGEFKPWFPSTLHPLSFVWCFSADLWLTSLLQGYLNVPAPHYPSKYFSSQHYNQGG
jgi:hypothetical protein